MRVRRLFMVFAMVLGLMAMSAPPAQANFIGLDIEVFVNNVSQGTATGGAIFDVDVVAGNTVTLKLMVGGTRLQDMESYKTELTVNDMGEATYITGSGTDLSGLNFAAFQAPDNVLPNGTASDGASNDNQVNSTAGSEDTDDFYSVDYLVVTPVKDGNVDIAFSLLIYTSPTGLDTTATDGSEDAFIRLNPVPEPATLLLVGTGLASLACFSRRRKRL